MGQREEIFFVILVRISNMIKSWRFFLSMWDVMCVKMATTRKMQKKLKSVRKENWELKWGVKWIFQLRITNTQQTIHTLLFMRGDDLIFCKVKCKLPIYSVLVIMRWASSFKNPRGAETFSSHFNINYLS